MEGKKCSLYVHIDITYYQLWGAGAKGRVGERLLTSAKVGQERAKVDQKQLKNGTRETKSENQPVLSGMEGTNCWTQNTIWATDD